MSESLLDVGVRDERPGPGAFARVVIAFLLLVLALAAGAVAAAVVNNRPVRYHAEAVLMIDQEPALTASAGDGLIDKLLRLRVKYVDTVRTTTFSDPLASTLGMSPGRVHSALGSVAPPSSLLLKVTADDVDAETARRIAQSGAESLRDTLAANQESLGIKPTDRVTLAVVTPARTGVKTSPSDRRVVLVGVVVALATLVGGSVLVDVLIRRRRQV